MDIQYQEMHIEEARSRFGPELSLLNRGDGYEMYFAATSSECIRGRTVIALHNNKVVGWGYTYQDWHPDDDDTGRRTYYCPLHVFVHPDYRRNKIGAQLARTLESITKRWRRKAVVWPDTEEGVCFYQSLGMAPEE